jgi:transcriptional antiterminator RfaH
VFTGSYDGGLRWYAVGTKPKQEQRVERNLTAWNVETFHPRVLRPIPTRRGGRASQTLSPLFPGYIFARFVASRMLHKVRFTRGVLDVVRCGGEAAPVDDEIIEFIRCRQDENGHVRIGEWLDASAAPSAVDARLRSFAAIFERPHDERERVEILLDAVTRPRGTGTPP